MARSSLLPVCLRRVNQIVLPTGLTRSLLVRLPLSRLRVSSSRSPRPVVLSAPARRCRAGAALPSVTSTRTHAPSSWTVSTAGVPACRTTLVTSSDTGVLTLLRLFVTAETGDLGDGEAPRQRDLLRRGGQHQLVPPSCRVRDRHRVLPSSGPES